ncbi:hypothetical protein EPN42_11190 [bacterium]|nr:MAG: hypothetical protein EPN42_11190 [bacterium]
MADHDDAFRDVLIRRLSRKVVRSAWPARREAALEAFPGMPKGVQRAIQRWARRSPAGGILSVDSPLYTQQLVAGVEAYQRWAAIAVRENGGTDHIDSMRKEMR